MNESLSVLVGEEEAERRLDALPFVLARDHLAGLMEEPAGPTKAGTGVRGHSPSGPVSEDGKRDRR